MLLADLVEVNEGTPRLARLREGVKVLNRIAHSNRPSDYRQWMGTAELMQEPLLAVEADALLDAVLEKVPGGIERDILIQVQQHARKVIWVALHTHRRQFGTATSLPLADAKAIADLANGILGDMPGLNNPQIEASILARLESLANVQGYDAHVEAFKWLRGILALAEDLGFPRLLRAVQMTMARFYLALVEKRDDLAGPQATALLRLASGGDARAFLNDLEDRRAGRSPVTTWMTEMFRQDSKDAAAGVIIAKARAVELALEMFDGQHFPKELSGDLLRASLEMRLPLSPSGEIINRNFDDVAEATLLVLSAINLDPRGGEPGMRAVDSALLMVGDPRVDSASLMEWASSILGERRFFGEVQFLRFLQEAHAMVAKLDTLELNHRLVISREHRIDRTEEMPTSFDFHIVDVRTGQIVESVEIKQTERPQTASDLGGILKQATRKIDDSALRQVPGRKSLVIQFPWLEVPARAARGGVVLVTHPDGTIVKWRADRVEMEGGKLGEENLFVEMAKHFPKIQDADFFHEIHLTDTDGKPVARFLRASDSPGQWRFVDESVVN